MKQKYIAGSLLFFILLAILIIYLTTCQSTSSYIAAPDTAPVLSGWS